MREARKAAQELCEVLGLTDLHRSTGELNILETKKMEIAKALANEPEVLFLDEVMAGLNTTETMDLIETVRDIAKERDLGVGVVEHVMGVIKELTERVVVLDAGALIASGPYEEVSRNERVISAYLGGSA
jgi:branched-chain amino acid transport system ATP-binding protein